MTPDDWQGMTEGLGPDTSMEMWMDHVRDVYHIDFYKSDAAGKPVVQESLCESMSANYDHHSPDRPRSVKQRVADSVEWLRSRNNV